MSCIKEVFCTKRQEPRARSVIMLSCQISGYLAYLTTLIYDNFLMQFWNHTFANHLVIECTHKIHKYIDIHLVIRKPRKSFDFSSVEMALKSCTRQHLELLTSGYIRQFIGFEKAASIIYETVNHYAERVCLFKFVNVLLRVFSIWLISTCLLTK